MLRRHFWRHATFDEVAELYASRLLRLAAVYTISSFISIYLYQNGFSITTIALVWAGFYVVKMFFALPSASIVGWIGPKHATLVANIMYIPAMIGFSFVPQFGLQVLLPSLLLQALSSTLYMVAYTVDFSKVKSAEHAGKEIGFMNIIEKLTAGLSPLVGGLIAFAWGPNVTIILSAFLFMLAAAPLFATGEPTAVRTKLNFKGFPWRLLSQHSAAQFAHGFEVFTTGTAWSLYIAVIIIGVAATNEVYAVMGLLLSVVFVVALIASYAYGKVIDRKKGRQLMKFSAVTVAAMHLVRPFISTPVGAAVLNGANEMATTGYTMPYTRAVFDNADLSGARITYLGVIEIVACFGAALAALILALLTSLLALKTSMMIFFFIAAGVILLILTARFPLYKK